LVECLGTLMMIPLRRSLIVNEHDTLPYPEGTACASVLQAGEKGGVFAQTAFIGNGYSHALCLLQKVFHVISEAPTFVTSQANKYLAFGNNQWRDHTRIYGCWVHHWAKDWWCVGGWFSIAWWAMIPLLSTVVDP
jgi:uncharacterized oligopeptide transporter (OPT) family protein